MRTLTSKKRVYWRLSGVVPWIGQNPQATFFNQQTTVAEFSYFHLLSYLGRIFIIKPEDHSFLFSTAEFELQVSFPISLNQFDVGRFIG